ncbi:MAG: helix-turn-helix transcriptional regulator [Dehalococcoidia bacterium]|nr:helix-turn-helix transcriptional regulator [Dehalococcoidia bacterium]
MAFEPDSLAAERDGHDLTERQREILALIARGYTNGDIAAHYGMSLDGAKWHVSEIITKLGLSSRDEAAEWWRARQGLRPRLRRFAGRLSLLPLPRLAAIGTAVLAGAGVLVVAVVALTMNEGGSPAGAPAQETATPTPTEPPVTPTLSGTPSSSPSAATPTAISGPVRREIPPGGSVTAEQGLVFLDPSTGGGEVWALPQGAMVGHASPSGRYIVYRQTVSASGCGHQRMVLDTQSGDTTKVDGAVTFSPHEEHAVVATEEATSVSSDPVVPGGHGHRPPRANRQRSQYGSARGLVAQRQALGVR